MQRKGQRLVLLWWRRLAENSTPIRTICSAAGDCRECARHVRPLACLHLPRSAVTEVLQLPLLMPSIPALAGQSLPGRDAAWQARVQPLSPRHHHPVQGASDPPANTRNTTHNHANLPPPLPAPGQVKWLGYGIKDCTWEPHWALPPSAISEYEYGGQEVVAALRAEANSGACAPPCGFLRSRRTHATPASPQPVSRVA